MRLHAVFAVLLILGGCSHSRINVVTGHPPNPDCTYPALALSSDGINPRNAMLGAAALTDADRRSDFGRYLQGVLQSKSHADFRPNAVAPAGVRVEHFLALSGGSQHGAFGAGFFYGLPKVPDYDVVTGISTGALQGSLIFIANQPVPADREKTWADGPLLNRDPGGSSSSADQPLSIKPGTTNLGDLALAYSIDAESDILHVYRNGLLSLLLGSASGTKVNAVIKGSSADFGPLRNRLIALLSQQTLEEIRDQSCDIRADRDCRSEGSRRRMFFVGVVNLDDGLAYAIDMGRLANQLLNEQAAGKWSPNAPEMRGCYVDALLASSSVPIAAFPVPLTLDTGKPATGQQPNLFVDGGARYDVFLGEVVGQAAARNAEITVLVNGAIKEQMWTEGARWNLIDFAVRSDEFLQNQVRTYSVVAAENLGLSAAGFQTAFMASDGLPARAEGPDDHPFTVRGPQGGEKNCKAWQDVDTRAKPLEFHPFYMACLADYARSRAADPRLAWNRRCSGVGQQCSSTNSRH